MALLKVPDHIQPDSEFSGMLMQWGQFIGTEQLHINILEPKLQFKGISEFCSCLAVFTPNLALLIYFNFLGRCPIFVTKPPVGMLPSQ